MSIWLLMARPPRPGEAGRVRLDPVSLNDELQLPESTGRSRVADFDATMAELRARGVVFEEYDGTNGPKTENGVARANGGAAAWFKDSEDNTLNLSQNPPGMSLDG